MNLSDEENSTESIENRMRINGMRKRKEQTK